VGFGLGARPAGVYVIKNGEARWRPAVNVNLIVAGGQLVAIAGLLALGAYFKHRNHDRAA
jgi:Na+/glutamate symporter